MNLVIFLREYQNMYQACINQEVIIGILRPWDHSLYFSQPPQPAVVYLFQAGALFCKESVAFWPFSANLSYFVANLCTFWCTFTG